MTQILLMATIPLLVGVVGYAAIRILLAIVGRNAAFDLQ
jgi:hypothetical protein